MSRSAVRFSLLGLFLVLFGALLLLKKAGIVDLHIREILWPSLALFGVVLAGRGLIDGRRGRIVGGTVLTLYSVFFLVRSYDRYDFPFETIVPATFFVFGVVFVMLFVNRPSEWYFLVPGLLLLLVGTSFMLTEFGYWYGWEVRDAVATWWPLALVLMGAGMLLRRRNAASDRPEAGGWGGGAPTPPPPPATGGGTTA